jgi:hypothetical protein
MPKVCRTKNVPRQKCRLCNNLDPRDHASTSFNDKKKATAQLSLALDVARLRRVSEEDADFVFCYVRLWINLSVNGERAKAAM